MRLLCICLFVLFASCYSSEPEEPRFCMLPANATTFSCDEAAYAESVAHRSSYAVIAPLILFIIVVILLLLPCLARTRISSCIGTDEVGKTESTRHGTGKHILWMILVIVVLVVGVACGILANVRSDETLSSSSSLLQVEFDRLLFLMANVNTLLSNTNVNITQAERSDILNAFNETESDVETIIHVQEKMGHSKDAFVYCVAAWIVIVGIFGLLFSITGRNFFFYLTLFMAFWVVLGATIFLGAIVVLNVALEDACQELDYNPGLLDLLHNVAQNESDRFLGSTQPISDRIVSSTCGQVEKYCPEFPDLCPCNNATFPGLPIKTIDENGTLISVKDCASTCENANVKELSADILQAVYAFNSINDLENGMQELIDSFTGNDTRAELQVVLCNRDFVGVPLFAGCVVVLLGIVFLAFTLLAIDRALCCFAQLESDESYTLY